MVVVAVARVAQAFHRTWPDTFASRTCYLAHSRAPAPHGACSSSSHTWRPHPESHCLLRQMRALSKGRPSTDFQYKADQSAQERPLSSLQDYVQTDLVSAVAQGDAAVAVASDSCGPAPTCSISTPSSRARAREDRGAGGHIDWPSEHTLRFTPPLRRQPRDHGAGDSSYSSLPRRFEYCSDPPPPAMHQASSINTY